MSRRSRNIAKALAKLHARVASLDPGSGGQHGEGDSPQMIAAAMGSVGAGRPGMQLALVVLCLKWWGDGVHGAERAVGRSRPSWEYLTPDGRSYPARLGPDGSPVTPRVRAEVVDDSGATKVVTVDPGGQPLGPKYPKALLEAIQAGNYAPPRAVLRSGRAVMAYARPQTTAAQAMRHTLQDWLRRKRRAGAWPLPERLVARIEARPSFWPDFVQAVLDEYCHPDRCPTCLGHGKELNLAADDRGRVVSRVIVCSKCEGRGLADRGVERRAKAVGLRRDDFQTNLQPAYVWLLNVVRHLEYTAARALNRALDDDLTDDDAN